MPARSTTASTKRQPPSCGGASSPWSGRHSPMQSGLRKGIWVEPKLLAEIEYRAKSAEGKVRHPFFKGLREDL
nr:MULTISPECIES: hypothetical protein [unclassified Bradyrhizobium]